MIHNNYQTIQYIVDHKDASLSTDLLLQIHRLMTNNTMANPEDAGRFRSNDDVVVENGITHETVHTPPSYKEIPQFIDDLCAFSTTKPSTIHPSSYPWHRNPFHDFICSPFRWWQWQNCKGDVLLVYAKRGLLADRIPIYFKSYRTVEESIRKGLPLYRDRRNGQLDTSLRII